MKLGKSSRLLLFCMAVTVGSFSCKHFIGNPHRRALPPKTVPALSDDMRVEPPNWWTGLQHRSVQILVRREGIAAFNVTLGESKGIRLEKVEQGTSPNYLFLTLSIAAQAPAQKVPLLFSHPKTHYRLAYEYPILARNRSPKAQGVDARDVLYLIYPDRFANGDASNDRFAGMADTAGRWTRDGRHGGDLKGIADHLDYLQDLGVTAVWLNPELENDQTQTSYHGYAITDLYRVDRRLGTNEQYRELVRQCHLRGMKMVRDVVPNHVGNRHYWVQDPPDPDWFNVWPKETGTNFRAPTQLDPYASEWDKKKFSDGWFSPFMPDLNQRNPRVAHYLIQQAIWWVEYAGIDAFRIDTYAYSDQAFLSRWCRELREEYPEIHLFGEVYEFTPIVQGYFADDQPMSRAGFDSNLPGVVDFQLCFALQEALTREQGWTEGVSRLYLTLAQDYFYKDPWKNVIMLDNHDMTRFFTVAGEDMETFKSGLALLMTLRGIPQLYYGTEILLTGSKESGDDDLRKEFPGGWAGDATNKFAEAGRTSREQEAFAYTRTLIRYRNATPALQTGKLQQFVPENGIYVYFRYDDSRTVMVALNTTNRAQVVETGKFAERLTGFRRARNIATGEDIRDISRMSIAARAALILEMQP